MQILTKPFTNSCAIAKSANFTNLSLIANFLPMRFAGFHTIWGENTYDNTYKQNRENDFNEQGNEQANKPTWHCSMNKRASNIANWWYK